MSRKVNALLNKSSKHYLGRNLPSDTTIELSKNISIEGFRVLSIIELNLCKQLISNWVEVYKKTGYRKGGFYILNKRLSLDLGLASELYNNKYIMYLHFNKIES